MKKNIKTGLLFIAIMFVISIIGIQVSNAGPCEDSCVPSEDNTCTAWGTTCNDFENYKLLKPIKFEF
jgi:hypothetical protein